MIATIATAMTTARSRITVALIPDSPCRSGRKREPSESVESLRAAATATRETRKRFRQNAHFAAALDFCRSDSGARSLGPRGDVGCLRCRLFAMSAVPRIATGKRTCLRRPWTFRDARGESANCGRVDITAPRRAARSSPWRARLSRSRRRDPRLSPPRARARPRAKCRRPRRARSRSRRGYRDQRYRA
jgi:hypothetical protein